MKSKEKEAKKTFSVRATEEEVERGMSLLDKLSGSRSDGLTKALNIVEAALASKGLAADYRSQIESIDASIDNIRSAAVAIVSAAHEERNRDTAKLREQLVAQDTIISDLKRETSELEAKLIAAEKATEEAIIAKQAAEKEAAASEAEIHNVEKRYADQMGEYQSRLREQAELIDMQREALHRLNSVQH